MPIHVCWDHDRVCWVVVQAEITPRTAVVTFAYLEPHRHERANTIAELLNTDADAHARAMLAISQPSVK